MLTIHWQYPIQHRVQAPGRRKDELLPQRGSGRYQGHVDAGSPAAEGQAVRPGVAVVSPVRRFEANRWQLGGPRGLRRQLASSCSCAAEQFANSPYTCTFFGHLLDLIGKFLSTHE